MSESGTARLVLPGSGTSRATVHVVHKSAGERGVRAAALLLGSWVLAPLLFFIPPHVVWPPLVVVAGLILAWRAWTREYVVESFEGSCPRCGEPLTLEPGSRIRGDARLECFNCHREPKLVLGESSDGTRDGSPEATSPEGTRGTSSEESAERVTDG